MNIPVIERDNESPDVRSSKTSTLTQLLTCDRVKNEKREREVQTAYFHTSTHPANRCVNNVQLSVS